MLKLSKAPEIEIRWGLQTIENRKKWINWVLQNINSIKTYKNISSDELEKLVSELFDEIHHCGYAEGYDSAKCDDEGEGL